MLSNFFSMFLMLVPIAVLLQWVRSRRLPAEQRHLGADVLEASGLALGLSTCQLNTMVVILGHPMVSSMLLFICVYFPLCFLADWIRKRPRNDS